LAGDKDSRVVNPLKQRHIVGIMNTDNTFKPERRLIERRQSVKDRRQMIRFELDKAPRRSGKDRRLTDMWAGRDQF